MKSSPLTHQRINHFQSDPACSCHNHFTRLAAFPVAYHKDSIGCAKAIFSNMKELIPEPWIWQQRSALLAALLAPLRDVAAWLVIVGLLLQWVMLNCAVFTSIPVYRHTLRRIKKVVA